jgi:hypothetical protein
MVGNIATFSGNVGSVKAAVTRIEMRSILISI